MKITRCVWNLKQEIHDLSHQLVSFRYENRTQQDWARFYGATDSIDDVGTALAEFRALRRMPTLLERLGFLQALVIQQHAVENISISIGLNWTPHSDERLKKVREIRDRVAGHPVWSEKGQKFCYPRSSAMQDLHHGTKDGFNVVVYFESKSENWFVSYDALEGMNEEALCAQLDQIKTRMNEMEAALLLAKPQT